MLGVYLRYELEAVWNAFCMEMRGRSVDAVGIVRSLGTQQECVLLLGKMYTSVNVTLQGQERFLRRIKRKMSDVSSRGEVEIVPVNVYQKQVQGAQMPVKRAKVPATVIDRKKQEQVGSCVQHLRHLFMDSTPCSRGLDCHFVHITSKTSVSKSVLLKEVENSSANMLRDPAFKRDLKQAIIKA